MPSDEQREAEAVDEDEIAGSEFPPEHPLGVDAFGTTEAEELYGEPLAERVSREEPEPRPGDDAAAVGQIADLPGEPDVEGQEVPLDVASDAGGPLDPPATAAEDLPAEESALTVLDEQGIDEQGNDEQR